MLSRLVVNAASIRERYRKQGLPVAGDGGDSQRRRCPWRSAKANCGGALAWPDDELLLLAAGRIESQKRFDRLLEIAALLLPSQPRLRVLIAGEGPLRAELEAEAQSARPGARVQCIGFLPDFAAVAGDADLFLLTSDDEGTPNVLLEAMAAGVACVAFGVGAVPEILTGALAANVILPGDTAAMAARAALLLQRPGAARVCRRRRCRSTPCGEFSFEQSMRRFETFFRQRVTP